MSTSTPRAGGVPGAPHVPPVAHLRVHEPLGGLDEPRRTELARALVRGCPGVVAALRAERVAGMVAVTTGRLPLDDATVGSLEPAQVTGGAHRVVGPGTLVCPWDTRPRTAAALLAAPRGLPDLLVRTTAPGSALEGEARAVLASAAAPVHVLSSTWAVPLAWFALVDPGAVQLLETDGLRRPVWRVAMSDVRVRGARVLGTVAEHLGETGTAAALGDVLRWLHRFPDGCAVELDYGGIGARLDDAALAQDRSCAVVHEVVGQLERGEGADVRDTLAPVLAFWARVRSWEHAS